jgi:hypothetical protein
MSELHKPSDQEDEYFAREEIEKKHRLAMKQAEELAEKTKEELKRLHHMKCPNCGMDLQALKKGPLQVDTCFHCRGVWLDEGEMEKLQAHGLHESGAVMKAILNIFKRTTFWKTDQP